MSDYDAPSRSGGSSSGGGGSTALAVLGSILLILGTIFGILTFFLQTLDLNNIVSMKDEMNQGGERLRREDAKETKKLNDESSDLSRKLRQLDREEKKLAFDKQTEEQSKSIQKKRNDYSTRLFKIQEELLEVQDLSATVERKEKWDKERLSLEDKIDEAQASARKRRAWYLLGTMIAFMMATAGAVCFLLSSANRVAGAILVYAVLQAAYYFATFSFSFSSRSGGF